MTNWLILIFACCSYYMGLSAVLKGRYKPSIYSRLVWALIALNGLLGVIALNNSTGVVILAWLQFLGSLAMFLASWKHSIKTFGPTEWACTGLLILSLIIWIFYNSPIVNVFISIFAHFIGGVPTFEKVWKKPASENFFFWFFFALASVLAFATADKSTLKGFIYTFYFLIFDSTISLLSARQFVKNGIKIWR